MFTPAIASRRPRPRNALTILMFTYVMLTTAACGSTGDDSTPTSAEGSIKVASCGRTVTLEAPAKTVVVIGAGSVDTLFEMGVGDRITGVVRVFADPAPKYAAQLKDLRDIGDALPGREALLALRPDLVITEQGRTLSGEEGTPSIAQLEEAGIAAYVVASGCDNNPVKAQVTDTFAEIEKFGVLLGAPEGARNLLDRLPRRLEATADRIKGRGPVKVAYISLIGSDVWVFTSGLDVDIVERAGGVNLWDDTSTFATVMSKEEITAANPQAIFFFSSTPTGDPLAFVRENFPTTDAVKNDRIHLVDPHRAARTGVRPVYQVEEFARFLHPEAFEQD